MTRAEGTHLGPYEILAPLGAGDAPPLEAVRFLASSCAVITPKPSLRMRL